MKIISIIIFYYYIFLYLFLYLVLLQKAKLTKFLLGINKNDSNCVKRDILCWIIQYKEFSHDKTTDTD